MSAEVVPFGKYRGQPMETLLADPDYCEWLRGQAWLRDKAPSVYNVVINYGGEPQDSPEHNEMQARFLDDDWCLKLANILRPGDEQEYGDEAAAALALKDDLLMLFKKAVRVEVAHRHIVKRRFEDGGWDVVFEVAPARLAARLTHPEALPPCICQCDHRDCGPESPELSTGQGATLCATQKTYCHHRYHDRSNQPWEDGYGRHCNEKCHWRQVSEHSTEGNWLRHAAGSDGRSWQEYDGRSYKIECKPDLGDDYPNVMRQLLRYPVDHLYTRCVLVRRADFQHVTWEQVVKIFAASDITLLQEGELTGEPE